jgi:hypothetical protein
VRPNDGIFRNPTTQPTRKIPDAKGLASQFQVFAGEQEVFAHALALVMVMNDGTANNNKSDEDGC